MTLYKEYTNEQYKNMFQHKFTDDYGISEDNFITWFLNHHGSLAVRTSYGVNASNLKSKYIPYLKKNLGGYTMFLVITANEGGGAGNWINHYQFDSSTDPIECMQADIDYIKTLLNNNTYPVARSAVEVLGGVGYTPDNGNEDIDTLRSLANDTIGRYYIPATMAGNSWVFATKWSLANQGPSAPYVYYNNPYDVLIDLYKKFGVDITKSSEDNQQAKQPSGEPHVNPEDTTGGALDDKMKELLNNILSAVSKLLTTKAYTRDEFTNMGNGLYNIKRLFNNYYTIKMTPRLLTNVKNSMGLKQAGGSSQSNNNQSTVPSNTGGSNGDSSKVNDRMLEWCKNHMGQWLDFDGVWGAQCVDMITTMNQDMNLNLSLKGFTAWEIYTNNQVPSDWVNKRITINDWDSIPLGAIIWWYSSSRAGGLPGHVGVKYSTEKWVCIQQNFNTDGNGGVVAVGSVPNSNASYGVTMAGVWYHK